MQKKFQYIFKNHSFLVKVDMLHTIIVLLNTGAKLQEETFLVEGSLDPEYEYTAYEVEVNIGGVHY